MHPRWQKEIIGLIQKQFPKVQFIISTHSPLCVIGTTELEDDDCTIIALNRCDNRIVSETTGPPRGQRADQVLTSYLFDLYTSGDNSIKRDIGRYKELLSKGLNETDKNEIEEIVNRLDDQIGSAETELERRVEQAVHMSLKDLLKKDISKMSPEDYEIRRQLDDLFKL